MVSLPEPCAPETSSGAPCVCVARQAHWLATHTNHCQKAPFLAPVWRTGASLLLAPALVLTMSMVMVILMLSVLVPMQGGINAFDTDDFPRKEPIFVS